jgi:hypothetical protein
VGFVADAGVYTRFADTPHVLAGDFSHKHAAYACGFGDFVNNLTLTANYGSTGAARVRGGSSPSGNCARTSLTRWVANGAGSA